MRVPPRGPSFRVGSVSSRRLRHRQMSVIDGHRLLQPHGNDHLGVKARVSRCIWAGMCEETRTGPGAI